nr:hypothetical protein [Streptomyces aurantiogriseus]
MDQAGQDSVLKAVSRTIDAIQAFKKAKAAAEVVLKAAKAAEAAALKAKKAAIGLDPRHPDVIQGSDSDLPFEDGTFRTVHAVNPFGFNPVNAETARVMERGGLLIVSAAKRNKGLADH